MNKFFKRIAAGCISVAMFISTANVFASEPLLIHERKTSENIASGVIHEHIQKFTSEGWWNINVLRVDLKDRYTEVGTLFSDKGISSRDKLTNMMNSKKAIAGINGDFFASFNYSSPVGVVISDKELISSPSLVSDQLAGFAIDEDDNPLLYYWKWDIKIITEDDASIDVKAINKGSSNYNEIYMYDRNWRTETFGNTLFPDMVEVIIEDDEVVDIRVGEEPIEMPEDGYILVSRGNARDVLLNNFNIGDEVSLKITTTPDYKDIKTAIGGGTILVKDGRIAEFTHNIPGNHPRTAIGITENKDELIMVTVDGRHTSFKGMSLETLAKIMIDLGAYEAINLDGGGSTTMAVNYLDQDTPTILNNPSDGKERPIINGIGVFNDAPKRTLSYIKIYTDDTNMFVNTTRRFYIKGFDKYHNPVRIDLDRASFKIEGIEGSFRDNILTAKKPGTGIVKVKYKRKTAELKINVFDNVKDILVEPDMLHVDIDSKIEFDNIYGKNDDGYKAKIYPEDIGWSITGDIGKIKDGVFYSSDEPSSGAITASLGDARENILVSVGYTHKLLEDFEDIDNMEFLSYPADVTGNIKRDNKDKSGKYSVRLAYDFTKTENTRAAYIKLGENGITIKDKPDKLGVWVYGNNSNHWVRGQLRDSKGNIYRIDFANQIDWKRWKWITANIPSGISYPITLERIYVTEINPLNKDEGYLLFDSLTALYSIQSNKIDLPEETVVTDKLHKSSDIKENGYRFVVTMGVNSLNNLLKYHVSKKISDIINTVDFGIATDNIHRRFTKEINKPIIEISGGYASYTHKDTLIIRLDNTKNSIRATNAEQWIQLKNTLESAKENNIIILLPKPVFGNNGFTDKLEAQLFSETLEEYKRKGKNVFVIHGGNQNKVDIINGIRYIEFDNIKFDSNTDIFDLVQIVFTVNNNEITYEILPVFKNQAANN
jgi:hypothetical protein